jgi:hypothetical protein
MKADPELIEIMYHVMKDLTRIANALDKEGAE